MYHRRIVGFLLSGIIIVFVTMMTACSHGRSHGVDFYYWKSDYEVGKTERTYFSELGSQRLYVRLFDVDVEDGAAVPVGAIKSLGKDKLPGDDVDVVPVVFVTNRTFLRYVSKDEVAELAKNILSGIGHIMDNAGIGYSEIQIDCDWTERTRDAYFVFLKALAAQSEMATGCTLRLHQIRDKNKTGVPPVDKGYLMCYATSSPVDEKERNSILDMGLLKAYTANINDYPLPFDVILPIYSWGVVTNHLGKIKLVNGLTEYDLQSPMFEKTDDDTFLVMEDGFVQGLYVNKGFSIKVEAISPELVSEAKSFLDKHIERDFDWVYFHLSEGYLTRFTIDNLK